MIVEYALSIGYTFATATELTYHGRPQPGHHSYSSRRAGEVDQVYSNAPAHETTTTDPLDLCDYDARGALVDRLEDPSVTRVERSRIVEVLAEMDALESDS